MSSFDSFQEKILILNRENIFDYWLEVGFYTYILPNTDSKVISNAKNWLPHILSRNYSAIIFLAGEINMINMSFIRKYCGSNSPKYIDKLKKQRILQIRKKSNKIIESYKNLTGVGKYHTNNLVLYELTDQAKSFFFQPSVMEIMKHHIDFEALENMIQYRKEDYEKNIQYRKEKQEREFKEEMRKAVSISSSQIISLNILARDSGEEIVIRELKEQYKPRDLIKTRNHIIEKGWESKFEALLICINKILNGGSEE
jgi:hypothetical protein